MDFLTASGFLKALGWALVNSLWQFAICWIVYQTIIAAAKNLAATVKHTIALSMLALGSIFFVLEFSWKFYEAPASVTNSTDNIIQVAGNSSLYSNWHTAGNYIDAFMPYWSLLYLACILLLFVKLCFFVRRADSLRHTGITKMNVSWRIYIKNIAEQLGIQKEVKTFLSVHIDTPQVIGFLKPVILIPAACLANLTTEQLEAVLLHELVHIKRNDYLINLFVASIEILFFFNPFVKQITAAIRKEREYSCDDMVIQFQYHPRNYAAALLTLEKNRLTPVTYGIAASGKNEKQLLTRIERIVGIKNKQTSFYQAGTGLIVLLLLGFMVSIHPAKTGYDEFSTGKIGFAGNIIAGFQFNDEIPARLTHKDAWPNVAKNNAADNVPKKVNLTTILSVKKAIAKNVLEGLLPASESSADENPQDDIVISNASDKESLDFTLPSKDIAIVPDAPDGSSSTNAEPYVPSSSFSFQLTQDSSMPKRKGETFEERKSREAMMRAQKAVTEINWKELEKNLKVSKTNIIKLKKALTLQIKNINWQKVNADVQLELNQDQLQSLQEATAQNKQIKQYQQSEAYYEALQKRLTEQQQIIQLSDLHLQENQKQAEEKEKKLQLDLKKRRIIYL